ncbi:Crp/Fnr family transcriptional regulator [Dyadobacter frigoris]|uniref:Cyclic nucleotide-binding domain-containing protein n=1 Tax=Dyadobacter frigoris TaxID=2576211 RepID=A0A4U6CRJ1_9BACT|nr:cyclic nucleotide-binding domain-containing protein [Dyadobacter frigoris]TKT85488.1 cyclic nucleotide-binding domain-containing protein [Dyadobacter frigoris]GLU56235.1 hypothetical protein Dfri01_56960 [Dyadobacter frigoris]
MIISKLVTYLNSLHTVSFPLNKHLRTVAQEKQYPKGYHLFKQGSMVNSCFYIAEGLIKSRYFGPDGKQFITRFYDQNQVMLLDSFCDRHPSPEDIVLLEDTTLLQISYQQGEYLNTHFTEVSELTGKINRWDGSMHALRAKLATMPTKAAIDHFSVRFDCSRISSADLGSFLGASTRRINQLRSN